MMTSTYTRETPLTDQERSVLDFFDGMGPDLATFRATYAERMADGVVWETVGRPPRVGLRASLDYLDTLHTTTGMEYCDIEVLAVGSSGSTVFTERIDVMKRADGSVFMEFRIVGVVELDEAGLITRYTDYCDLSALS